MQVKFKPRAHLCNSTHKIGALWPHLSLFQKGEDFFLPHEQKRQKRKSNKGLQEIIIKSLSTSGKDPKLKKIYF